MIDDHKDAEGGAGERILVAMSSTAQGKAAFESALAEAKLRGAKLIVVEYVRMGSDDSEHDLRSAAQRRVEAAQARASSEGLDCEHRIPVGISPAGAGIVRAAEDADATLIIIGIRNRSRVGKLVLGSNAQHVLLHAPCAVLAIKSD